MDATKEPQIEGSILLMVLWTGTGVHSGGWRKQMYIYLRLSFNPCSDNSRSGWRFPRCESQLWTTRHRRKWSYKMKKSQVVWCLWIYSRISRKCDHLGFKSQRWTKSSHMRKWDGGRNQSPSGWAEQPDSAEAKNGEKWEQAKGFRVKCGGAETHTLRKRSLVIPVTQSETLQHTQWGLQNGESNRTMYENSGWEFCQVLTDSSIGKREFRDSESPEGHKRKRY